VKYAWINEHRDTFDVQTMCRLLHVSKSAFYDSLKAKPCLRTQENEQLKWNIQRLFQASRGTYGTRRLQKALRQEGRWVSRKRIGHLMNQQHLACKTRRKFKVTTDSKHTLPIAANLLDRQFQVSQPNRCWVGDITYIATQEGWLYLAVVIDLFSRKVVGWCMREHMKASLVNDALLMALWARKPSPDLIWHTDRGSQYASDSHRLLLKEHHLVQSMSRKGNCWDNAVAESFFHTLKTEWTYHQTYPTREEAKQSIFEYIEVFYNRKRFHSANQYLSPMEFEKLKIAV
jgi:putative transposase